jgi:hypothetical protein
MVHLQVEVGGDVPLILRGCECKGGPGPLKLAEVANNPNPKNERITLGSVTQPPAWMVSVV